MTTALRELDEEVLDKISQLSDDDGYRALDLIKDLRQYSESDIQRAVAMLLVSGRIQLTANRRLKKLG
jgi:hypothetical protein